VIDQYFKTWVPRSRFQQKWELYIRGFGVMIDDIAAALATLVLLSIIYRIFL
jgi:phosphatidylglycerophosphatase A